MLTYGCMYKCENGGEGFEDYEQMMFLTEDKRNNNNKIEDEFVPFIGIAQLPNFI